MSGSSKRIRTVITARAEKREANIAGNEKILRIG
jgi:hypothetical protein